MGAVPKRRISTGRKGRRRSAIKLNLPALISCPNCEQIKRPHSVCPSCGFYKGKMVTKTKAKKDKKDKKGKGRGKEKKKKKNK